MEQPSPNFQQPVIDLPVGGGAIKGLGDTYQASGFNGAGSMDIPLPLPEARGRSPQLALSYHSGSGNGSFGMGFDLALSAITRKTSKGIPSYDERDVFLLDEAELVPVTDENGKVHRVDRGEWVITFYRPRIEGSFARIEHHCQVQGVESYWRVISGNNVTTVYGRSSTARIANPSDGTQVFSWKIEETSDPNGNRTRYHYKAEDEDGVPLEVFRPGACNSYLDQVEYGNYFLEGVEYFAFRVQLQYAAFDPRKPGLTPDPWEVRPDPFSSFISGFEVRNYRLCQAILVYHQFQGQFDNEPVLSAALHLSYSWDQGTDLSFLAQARQWAYRINREGNYECLSLPALDLHYHDFQPGGHRFRHLRLEGNATLPGYLWNGTFTATDLYSEGLPGFLLSNEQTTLYWEPMGEGMYKGPIVPETFPLNADLQQGNMVLSDLESNGYKSLVTYQGGTVGYYQADQRGRWAPFVPFEENAVELTEPEALHVDLSGDGLADLLIFDGMSIRWYPALGTKGYGKGRTCTLPAGFPSTNNDSKEVLLTFADLNGDGLADYVRIANGEVQYWPSKGYGAFGEAVRMQDAPLFGKELDVSRLHLADIDGSGTADIIYMEYNRAVIWFNRSGNSFSPPIYIPLPFTYDSISEVNFADVLGNGTQCMVLTRIEPEVEHLYYDFAGGRKCYLMNRVENNAGIRQEIHYSSTVQQYLADKRAGREDASRLFFPVQLVTRHVTIDQVSHALHVSNYAYHDGYFDPEERIFRGFGFVESWDTDHYRDYEGAAKKLDFAPATVNRELHVPPSYTKSWYHTGAFAKADAILAQYRNDYYQGDTEARSIPSHSFSPDIEQADAETYRQAYVALEGQLLRQELYGLDGSERENDPFTVSETHVHVRLVQARHQNRYVIFFPYAQESITWTYERDPTDPLISHSFELEVDAYGNSLRSAALAYPRRPHSDRCVFPEQETTHMTLDETAYATLFRDDPDNAKGLPACRWTGIAYENRSYQVKTQGLPAGQLGFETVKDWTSRALQNPLPYHEAFAKDNSPGLRLLSHNRSYFWNEGQTEVGALGELSSRNLSHHTETALGTAAFYATVFGDKMDSMLMSNEGGYILREDTWWAASPVTSYFNQAEQFYLPKENANIMARDLPPDPLTGAKESALYSRSRMAYDSYYLFNISISAQLSDTVDLTTNAEIDYQALQPWRTMDPNLNIQEVLFDALGQVIVATTYGTLQGKTVGNRPLAEYNIRPASFEDILENPSIYLQKTNSFYYYDLHAWTERRQPLRSIALVGEKFSSQLAVQEENTIQVAVAYNDGAGRTIEVKQLSHDATDPGALSGQQWTVSGRTVHNNKGLPTQQYLPYFSAIPDYEDQQAIAMESLVPPPSVIHYDALDRAIRTDDPKGFYSRINFSPWKAETFDANDTLADSKYFKEHYKDLPKGEKEALDKALACSHTPSIQIMDNLGRVIRSIENKLGVLRLAQLETLAGQQQATAKELFGQLVASGMIDRLGGHANEGVLSEATLHWNEDLISRLTEQFGAVAPALLELLYQGRMTSLNAYDIQGRTLLSIDPRLYYHNLLNSGARYNFTYTYNMAGETLHTWSCDAGGTWQLNNLFGLPVHSWDSRGFITSMHYDRLQRPLLLQVSGGDGDAPLDHITQKTVYGEAAHNALENNLMGRTMRSYDEAGLTAVNAYSLNGQPQEVVQQFRADYKQEAHWTADACDAVAKEEQFITVTESDALARTFRQITPDGAIIEPTYNRSGYFKAMQVAFESDAPRAIVEKVVYDAQGKPAQVDYGNGITTRYGYEASTQRLTTLQSYRRSGAPNKEDLVQDLRYWYDPVGNVSAKADHSWSTVFHANQQVDPQNDYVYDPLYRLIRATGRQQAYTGAMPPNEKWLVDKGIRLRTANPDDPNQLENYTEGYVYDFAGNLTALQHRAARKWTYRFATEPDSNRLAGTDYDQHGNTRSLDHLQNMRWDYRNTLASAEIVSRKEGPPDIEYYVYSSNGSRLRKVNERIVDNGAIEITDTLYLGSYERKTISIKARGNTVSLLLQRNTLKVDGPGNTACFIHHWPVDTRKRETSREGKRQYRYQLGDMQGSVGLELNEEAQLITYEEYYPYGNTAFTVGRNQVEVQLKTYRYSGQERDATGLYYYGARYYPPWLCRWLNPDPGGTIDGLNLYAFVRGNPISNVDAGGFTTMDYFGNIIDKPPTNTQLDRSFLSIGESIGKEMIKAEKKAKSDMLFLNALEEHILQEKTKLKLPIQDEGKVTSAMHAGLSGNKQFANEWRAVDAAQDEHLATASVREILKGIGNSIGNSPSDALMEVLQKGVSIVSHMRAPTSSTGIRMTTYTDPDYFIQHPTSREQAVYNGEKFGRHNRWDSLRKEDMVAVGNNSGEKGIWRLIKMAFSATAYTINSAYPPSEAGNIVTLSRVDADVLERQMQHREMLKRSVVFVFGPAEMPPVEATSITGIKRKRSQPHNSDFDDTHLRDPRKTKRSASPPRKRPRIS